MPPSPRSCRISSRPPRTSPVCSIGPLACTYDLRAEEGNGGSDGNLPSTMVASGSTYVGWESEAGLGRSIKVGVSEVGGGFETELSPLTGTPTPPCFAASPGDWGSNRGFRFSIVIYSGRRSAQRQ